MLDGEGRNGEDECYLGGGDSGRGVNGRAGVGRLSSRIVQGVYRELDHNQECPG